MSAGVGGGQSVAICADISIDSDWVLSCVIVDGDPQSKSLEEMLHQLEGRVEKNFPHWVTAVIDSSLGQFGIVGELAVEEFMDKLKSAFVEILAAQTVMPSGTSRRVSESGPWDTSSVALGVAAGGSSTVSQVPTAFGDPWVMSTAGDVPVTPASGTTHGNHSQYHM